MHCCCHHRSKGWLTIERSPRIVPIEVSPGIGQVKAEAIPQHVYIQRVHEDGENQRSNDGNEDCTSHIPFDLTSNVRGELETDKLEEDDTGKPCQADQSEQLKIGTTERVASFCGSIANGFRRCAK